MMFLGMRFGYNKKSAIQDPAPEAEKCLAAIQTMINIKPGGRAKVLNFSPAISPDRRAHLQAYGVVPGRCVKIIQHFPVTVIQVEQTELALETELAGKIEVETGDLF